MARSPRSSDRTRRSRRRWVAAAVVAVVVGGSGTAYAMTRSTPASATNAATSTVLTVARSTIRQTVAASGTLRPAREADLSFAVGGEVTAVRTAVGEKVVKGERLATVDMTALQAAVDAASANVTAASEQLTAQQDAAATTVQLASAKAQLASARTTLSDARTSLAAATLVSPIAGTVASLTLAVGDTVSGSGNSTAVTGASNSARTTTGSNTATTASTTSTSAQIVVISTDAFVVDASVGSADLAQVKKGLQAQITPTGSATTAFGIVSSVGIMASSSTSGSATFPVTINVTGKPTGLYAGGTATVSIIVKQVPNVLTVATQALKTTGATTTVTVRKAGKDVTTPVVVGTSYGPSTQVVSGLEAGDQVVVTFVRPSGVGGVGGAGGRNRGTTGGGAGGFGGFGGGAG